LRVKLKVTKFPFIVEIAFPCFWGIVTQSVCSGHHGWFNDD
jgi:hypothetical protein